ncbi:TPA: hypothetical protein ACXPQL_004140 [Salmonella enterica]
MVTRAELLAQAQERLKELESQGKGPVDALRRIIAADDCPEALKQKARDTLKQYGFTE